MIKTKAKFKVQSVEIPEGSPDQRQLVLEACIDESGDNQNWSKWTPAGRLELTITNEHLFPGLDALSPGDLYWLDINPVY